MHRIRFPRILASISRCFFLFFRRQERQQPSVIQSRKEVSVFHSANLQNIGWDNICNLALKVERNKGQNSWSRKTKWWNKRKDFCPSLPRIRSELSRTIEKFVCKTWNPNNGISCFFGLNYLNILMQSPPVLLRARQPYGISPIQFNFINSTQFKFSIQFTI